MKTLAALQDRVKQAASSGGGKNFLSLKDGDQYQIRFLQELSEDSKNFKDDRGTAELIRVHTNPLNFRKKIACSAEDQGACWACEQVSDNYKWKPVDHLLVNVAYKDGETLKVAVLDQTFSAKKVGNDIVEFASEYLTLTDRTYKIKRTGAKMNDTQYNLMPLAEAKEPEGIGELNDLKTVYKVVAYDQQEQFLTAEEETQGSSSSSW